ncbi:putative protein without homology [Propionibacterium freudenreichii subsp. shermanii]|nr:putative protein without homology [Propionibacterium freudenreichii subsp. shermanii]
MAEPRFRVRESLLLSRAHRPLVCHAIGADPSPRRRQRPGAAPCWRDIPPPRGPKHDETAPAPGDVDDHLAGATVVVRIPATRALFNGSASFGMDSAQLSVTHLRGHGREPHGFKDSRAQQRRYRRQGLGWPLPRVDCQDPPAHSR